MRALVLLVALAAAAAPAEREPAIGRFLIAKPQVSGFFAGTVILLVDHGAHGSLGLIVNRPLDAKVAEVVPELPGAREHDEPAFLGGPVARDKLLLLVRAQKQPAGGAPVLEHVFVSGNRDTLRALLEESPEKSEFRAYVGYAGWAPDQLDAEIARGDWLLAPGDEASVFTREPSALWEQLFQKHRMIEVRAPPHLSPVAARAKSITLSAPWRSAAASSGSRTSASPRSSTR